MSGELSNIEIRRFFRLLLQAYYDCVLEDRFAVEFYVDADVVIGTVLGFEDGVSMPVEARLVRSLMACGQLPEFRMVRPHALELFKFLAGRSTLKYDENYRARVKAHVDVTGIKTFLNQLKAICLEHESLADSEKPAAIQRFISLLRKAGGEQFASIEAMRGPWKHRYKCLARLTLRLDQASLGPEMHERDSLDSKIDAEIMRYLEDASSKRKGADQRSHWANFRDACALSMISRKIKERRADDRLPLVRFYTDTSVVKQAFDVATPIGAMFDEHEVVANALESPLPFNRFSILRNSEYFLLRFAFSELGFGRSPGSHAQVAGLITDLRSVEVENPSVDLKPVLRELETRGYLIDGRKLSEAISDFQALRLIRAIWTRKSFGDVFERLAHWTLVFDFAQNTTREVLDDEIVELQDSLWDHVHQIQGWMYCFRKLKDSIRRFQRVFTPERQSEIASLVKEDQEGNLGLVRWGIRITPEVGALIAEYATVLVDEDGVGWEDGCRKFAALIHTSQTSEETTAVCAVLWMFGDYLWIYQILSALGERKIPAFSVWENACWIRCVRDSELAPDATAACRRRIDALKAHVERTGDVSILLGCAYFLYHCWRRVKPQKSLHSDTELCDIHSSWLCASLEYAERVLANTTPSSLQWAFALNHSIYVGMDGGLEVSVIMARVEQLLSLEPDKGLWNARFADTIACYFMWRIERAIATSHESRSQLFSWLDQANAHMRFAVKNAIGDIAVNAHTIRLESLTMKVQKVASDLS